MYFGTLNTIAKLVFLLGAIGASGWPAGSGTTTPPPRARRRLAPSGQARSLLKQAPAAKKDEGPFRMTGTVRVEGTGEPVAGARVQVELGSRDLSGDFVEAVTDKDGRYLISLPEGNARPLFFTPPRGYWLPEPSKHWRFFAVTPREPVHREDYRGPSGDRPGVSADPRPEARAGRPGLPVHLRAPRRFQRHRPRDDRPERLCDSDPARRGGQSHSQPLAQGPK